MSNFSAFTSDRKRHRSVPMMTKTGFGGVLGGNSAANQLPNAQGLQQQTATRNIQVCNLIFFSILNMCNRI